MPKNQLPKILQQASELISLPARVQNYLDAQSGVIDAPYLLPVSCRLKKVETLADILISMIWIKQGAGVKLILPERLPSASTESSGVTLVAQDSLLAESPDTFGIYEALVSKCNRGDDIDFSLLRPKGSPCRGGLIASGKESFEAIAQAIDSYRFNPSMFRLLYLIGLINDVMVRGGYNRGIITTSYPASGSLLLYYLGVDLARIPGSLKREVRFKKGVKGMDELSRLPFNSRLAIAESRQFSSLMLAKESSDGKGNTLYTNVCEGIYLKSEDSCLIVRVPLGRLTIDQIVPAYVEAYKFGKALWEYWHKQADGKIPYSGNSADVDRQIAIDPFGLANLLAEYRITYTEFISAMFTVEDHLKTRHKLPNRNKSQSLALQLAIALYKAHHRVAKLNAGFFERVFTVEPSQSHAFRERDKRGYTFARGIWAVWSQYVQRDSDRQGSKVYEYPTFETLSSQSDPVKIQEDISKVWFNMMNSTGLAHAISHDTYYEFTTDSLVDWVVYSDLPSLYYNFYTEVNQVVAKTVEEVSLDGIDLTPACDPTAGFCQVCGA